VGARFGFFVLWEAQREACESDPYFTAGRASYPQADRDFRQDRDEVSSATSSATSFYFTNTNFCEFIDAAAGMPLMALMRQRFCLPK